MDTTVSFGKPKLNYNTTSRLIAILVEKCQAIIKQTPIFIENNLS